VVRRVSRRGTCKSCACVCVCELRTFSQPHYFLLLSRGVPQEDAERSEEDIHDADDGHQPREADVLGDGASDGRTWRNTGQGSGVTLPSLGVNCVGN